MIICMKQRTVQCCSKDVLTADSRHVFSRSAPTQPVKPMINVTVPRKERESEVSAHNCLRENLFFLVTDIPGNN